MSVRLCNLCQTLDFDKILDPSSIPDYLSKPIEIVKFNNHPVFAAGCDLCNFFVESMRIDRSDEWNAAEVSTCSLYSYPSYAQKKYVSNYTLTEKGVFLMLAPSKDPTTQRWAKPWNGWAETYGYIMPVHQPTEKPAIRARRLVDRINLDIVRGWMATCASIHPSHRARPHNHNIQHLRLINCHSLEIVLAATTDKYVALSYVWGDPKLYSMNEVTVRPNFLAAESLPNVIMDAIKVTLEIGIDFLWVDRYCIPQDDRKLVQYHLGVMHKVYQNAEATIIAAAGTDPSFGLPGIGNGHSRISQPNIQLGTHQLVFTYGPPQKVVQTSKWASRAWVFQEALFSRRRLIFTTQQVHFECDSMHCTEAVDTCPELLSREREKGEFFGRNTLEPIERNDLKQKIEHYSRLELSHDADSLNAMMGILRAYETLPSSGRHASNFFGIPMGFNDFLSKGYQKDFIEGLKWTHLQPSRRRTGFPSWSWAGWAGEVQYYDYMTFVGECNDVKVEDTLGRQVRFVAVMEERMLRDGHLPENLTHYLHLTVWTVKLWFGQLPRKDGTEATYREDRPELYAKSDSISDPKPFLRLSLSKSPTDDRDIYNQLQRSSWDCIILGRGAIRRQITGPFCMVLDWHGNFAERLGCLTLGAVRDPGLEEYIWKNRAIRRIRLG